MTKVLRGLVRQKTFEELVDTSDTYDFTDDIHIYSSAALNYRQSFFAPPLGDPDVVDAQHDDKHEAVLAQMRAIAAQQEQREQTRRENDRAMFAHVLATHRATMAEHAAQPPVPGPQGPPGPPGPPGPSAPGVPATPSPPLAQHSPVGILGSAGAHKSWQAREAERKEQYKPMPVPGNESRQKARQQAERAAELNRRRAEGIVERYDIDRSPEPDQAPRPQMQERYDERIRQRNTPLTTRTASARSASAYRGRQAATSRQRNERDRVIRQTRDRALIPPASAPPRAQVEGRRTRNDTPPRRRNIGPLATTPRLP